MNINLEEGEVSIEQKKNGNWRRELYILDIKIIMVNWP